MCRPAPVIPVRSCRSSASAIRSIPSASSGRPARASSDAVIAGDSEDPCAVRGS
jgi:hypothetical protein